MAYDYETVMVRIDDGVAWVSLNRPKVRNAINQQMQDELAEVWTGVPVRRRRAVRRAHRRGRVVLHRASTEPKPCPTRTTRRWRPATTRATRRPWMYDDPGRDVGPKSRDLWKPVIAAVQGMACGGAFYMLGEVEFIIASDDAVFFDPHVTYGMTAAFEPIQMLSKMPFHEIMRLSLLGAHERMSAERAHQIGLVSEVVPRGAPRAGRVGRPGDRRLTAARRPGNHAGSLDRARDATNAGDRHSQPLHEDRFRCGRLQGGAGSVRVGPTGGVAPALTRQPAGRR